MQTIHPLLSIVFFNATCTTSFSSSYPCHLSLVLSTTSLQLSDDEEDRKLADVDHNPLNEEAFGGNLIGCVMIAIYLILTILFWPCCSVSLFWPSSSNISSWMEAEWYNHWQFTQNIRLHNLGIKIEINKATELFWICEVIFKT